MNIATKNTLIALILVAVPALVAADVPTDAPSRLAEGRAISERFAAQLKSALQSAMAEGGPVAAVSVCKDEAPRIASALSRETGAKVRRTSLRYRNPANAPEPWEARVLEAFDTEARTDPGAPPERFLDERGAPQRYMRAIPTAPLCLACHGKTLAPAVATALDRDYPHDRARGYSAGEIRGAFSISWPSTEQ